jgi:hypothetical protein
MNDLRGAFRVLQVVSTAKTDTFTTTSTSYTDVTGLSVSITPQSSTSKILVLAQINGADAFGTSAGWVQLVRGSTAIDIGDTAGSRISASGQFSSPYGSAINNINLSFLDSPATTSATTYKIQARTYAGSIYVNRSQADSDSNTFARGASTITVMEISA